MSERVLELINLIKENPGLEIVPMVATDCIQDDGYGYWLSRFGCARVEKYCCTDERVHLRNTDDEDLLNEYMDKYEGHFNFTPKFHLTEEEAERWAKKEISKLPWKKAIIFYIECA